MKPRVRRWQQGMQAGLQTMQAALGKVRSSGELFGSREYLGSNYVSRAVGAMVGILGNSAEEYLGIGYPADADGRPFDGSHAYRIKFKPSDLPPVKAFWSITVYNAAMLLYANPLKRYVINSAMLDQLVRDADGGFTLYVQHESPGRGQGIQLAAGSPRTIQPDVPRLSAGAGDPGFHLSRAAGCESRVSRPERAAKRSVSLILPERWFDSLN